MDDTTKPTLSLNPDTVYVTKGGTYVEPNVTAFDRNDGDLRTKVIKSGTVDVNVPDVYVITYSVSDLAGNTATADCYVIVTPGQGGDDNVPPVITLEGDDTLHVPENMTIEEYKLVYVEPGYDATDDVDGNIKDKVKIAWTQLSVQYWYISYSVSDAAGNAATPKRRFINTGIANNASSPVIELDADTTVQLVIGTQWNEPGYDAYTVEDGNVINLKDQVIVVDTNLTNNINVLGTYQILYSVTNSSGLTAQKIRHVKVIDSEYDTQKPVINLIGGDTVKVLVGSSASFIDPGCTAEDNRDGDITKKVTVSGTVNMNKLGIYKLSYTVSDLAFNSTTVYRAVWVVADTTNTDLLVRYNVLSADPLPSMSNITWVVQDVDGLAAPDLSYLTNMSISWSLENNAIYDFRFNYAGPPNSKGLSTEGNTLGQTAPMLKITDSEIEGLDNTYYVTVIDDNFIWVEQKGTFAIIWSK